MKEWCLGPLHMSPVTGLAGLSGRISRLLSVQPGRPGYNSRNKTKLVEHKLVSFATIVDCFNFTTTSVVEKHTRQKLCHFYRYVAIGKLFCQKNVLSRSPGMEHWYGKIFSSSPLPRYESQSPRFW